MKQLFSAGLFALALTFGVAAPVFAQDATPQQIYQAAEAGRMGEAQQMLDKVLHDKPNSSHAHYVQAQLFAKEGRYGEARAELDTAQRLAPGLPFAKPEAVQQLRQRIDSAPARVNPGFSGAASGSASNSYSRASYGGGGSGFPWGLVVLAVIGGGIAYLIARALRARRANRMNRAIASSYGQNPGVGPYGPQPYGPQPYGPAGYPPAGGGLGGGLGAGILGGLATGAAVGAGAVAAESLLHHFTDSDRHSGNAIAPPAQSTDYQPFDDMGGDNFGMTDSSSWDDSGSSGGDFSSGGDW